MVLQTGVIIFVIHRLTGLDGHILFLQNYFYLGMSLQSQIDCVPLLFTTDGYFEVEAMIFT
jgi:hypothetical protein